MFAYPAHVIAQAYEEALMTPVFTEAETEFVREDVRDAVIDALAMQFTDKLHVERLGSISYDEIPIGFSGVVTLAPLELEF